MYRMAGERHDAAADKHLARGNRDLDEPVTMESADGQPFDDDGDTFAEDTLSHRLPLRLPGLQRFTTPSMPPATGFQEDISHEVGRDLTAKQLGDAQEAGCRSPQRGGRDISTMRTASRSFARFSRKWLTALDKIAVVKDYQR